MNGQLWMDTQVVDEIQESLDLIKKMETPTPVAVDNTPLIDELKCKIKSGMICIKLI